MLRSQGIGHHPDPTKFCRKHGQYGELMVAVDKENGLQVRRQGHYDKMMNFVSRRSVPGC